MNHSPLNAGFLLENPMDNKYLNVGNVALTLYHNKLKAIKFVKEQIYKNEIAMNAVETLDEYEAYEKIADTVFHRAFSIEKGYWMYALDGAVVSSEAISIAIVEIKREFR